jgi:small subunit ribosomal protein S16
MAVRIRLQRHGKKGKPFYQIVVADARARRDGRFIDKVGSYNPTTIPATIQLDVDKALDWVLKGAEPTDTVRAILSYKGVMFKKHLLRGVSKGSFTLEVAEQKFQEWVNEKEGKITTHKQKADATIKAKLKASVEAGKDKAEARLKAKEVAPEEEVVEEAIADQTEEVVAEATPEAVVEEVVEETPEVVAETTPEVADSTPETTEEEKA